MKSYGNDCACIIGARKGSKRLPGKNRALLNGKPLYAYAIESALNSAIFSKVIFTTDDGKIMEQLAKYPDIIPDARPPTLAKDEVPMWDVVVYLLEKYSHILSGVKDLCLLSPCQPFRTGEHIREAYQMYKEAGATSLVSITQFPFPPELSLNVIKGKVMRSWKGLARKHQYKKRFYPNGAISIVDHSYFVTKRDVYSPNTVGYEMQWPYGLDIDYREDFEMARLIGEKIICI